MAWFRVQLTEEQQRIVNEERVAHPDLRAREKMLVLWLLHCGATREKAAQVVGVSRPPSSATSPPSAPAAWTDCVDASTIARSASWRPTAT
jgi:hypothetical protein